MLVLLIYFKMSKIRWEAQSVDVCLTIPPRHYCLKRDELILILQDLIVIQHFTSLFLVLNSYKQATVRNNDMVRNSHKFIKKTR